MTIRELQTRVANALNEDDVLVQMGCRAFAEDALTVQNEISLAVSSSGKIALVVLTPRVDRDGSGVEDGIPVGVNLQIRCIETPATRSRRNGATALDAAEHLAHFMDDGQFEFTSIEQTADAVTGTVQATAEFGFSTILTNEKE